MSRTGLCFFIRAALAVCVQALCIQSLCAEKFEFKHREGDKFRLLSTTQEEVLLNNKLMQSSRILNRMAQEVRSISGGRAQIFAVFNIAQEIQGGETAKQSEVNVRYNWGEEYSSEFMRDKLGKITIDTKYFMPSARDVPLFPDRVLNSGESWVSQGNEVFDLRHTFNITSPYLVPFRATNTFVGERVWKNKNYKAIQIRYNLLKNEEGFENSPYNYLPPRLLDRQRGEKQQQEQNAQLAIKRITGSSTQILYWDEELGQIAAAEDIYELNFELTNGEKWTFRGKTQAEIIEAETMNKDETLRDVEKAIKELNIGGVTVKKVDNGISINLENIQFEADSARLLESEKEKLDKIAAILKRYNERDILISGHTAQAGAREEVRQKLSEERAGAVASYFIKEKVRAPQRIITRGYGSSRPLASNTTEEGRSKNRRVEITILEN